jgi:hypothetical protein
MVSTSGSCKFKQKGSMQLSRAIYYFSQASADVPVDTLLGPFHCKSYKLQQRPGRHVRVQEHCLRLVVHLAACFKASFPSEQRGSENGSHSSWWDAAFEVICKLGCVVLQAGCGKEQLDALAGQHPLNQAQQQKMTGQSSSYEVSTAKQAQCVLAPVVLAFSTLVVYSPCYTPCWPGVAAAAAA